MPRSDFFELAPQEFYEDASPLFPSSIRSFHQSLLELESGTHFGFILDGTPELTCCSGTFALSPGMYFAVPGRMRIIGGSGMIMTRQEFNGLFQIGGPIESTGRLRYIDGCSDTLLVPPVVCGDACLNLLHIPPVTQQTRHTHPSLRAGVIVSGHGVCKTPHQNHELREGMMFVIPAEGAHSFHTTDSDLLVIAYHPDSDTGPKHDDHPMVNRTFVDGVSAALIKEIRT